MRYFIPLFIFALVVGMFVASKVASRRVAPSIVIGDEIFAMGSVCRITLFDNREETPQLRRTLDEALRRISEVDASCSLYKDDSDISRVNSAAFLNQVQVGDVFANCLQEAVKLHNLTNGAYNPLIRPILSLWGFGPGGTNAIPHDDAITAALPLSDISNITLDCITKSVRFSKEGVAIDLNGIAQGFATARAALHLQQNGIKSALVESGGGEFALIGSSSNGAPFRIGVRKPVRDSKDVIARLLLFETSLATSGDYEKYFEVDGKRFSHIFDPRTGRPRIGAPCSVTVIGPDCSVCDGLSTACAVLGKEAALSLIESIPNYELLFIEQTEKGDTFSYTSGIDRKDGDFFLKRQAKDIFK